MVQTKAGTLSENKLQVITITLWAAPWVEWGHKARQAHKGNCSHAAVICNWHWTNSIKVTSKYIQCFILVRTDHWETHSIKYYLPNFLWSSSYHPSIKTYRYTLYLINSEINFSSIKYICNLYYLSSAVLKIKYKHFCNIRIILLIKQIIL